MSDFIRFVGPFDRVLFMKGLPHTAGLTTGEVGVLARVAREKSFRRGRKVIESGAPVKHWYMLVEGRARAIHDGVSGLGLRAPDAMGLLDLLADSEQEVEIVAETDLITLEIPFEATLEIFEDHFAILQATMRGISARILEHLRLYIVGTHRQIWPAELDTGDMDLDLVERILLFRRSPFFQEVSLETMVQLVNQMTLVRMRAGSTLWRQGEPAEDTMMILSGKVRGTLQNGLSFTAGAGYPLGNVEVMARQRRWYDAVADTDVVAMRLASDLLMDVFEDQFDIALRFLRAQARGLLRYLLTESQLLTTNVTNMPTHVV